MSGIISVAGLLVAALAGGVAFGSELDSIRAESNLVKRASRALEHAESKLHAAEDAYRNLDWGKTMAALQDMRQAVELAHESLKLTGKSPRKSPGPFKKAEIKTRKMQRHLEDFLLKMSVEEREQLEAVRASLQKVHEDLLKGILEGEWEKKS